MIIQKVSESSDYLKEYLKIALKALTFEKKELVLIIVLLLSSLTTEFTANSYISYIFIPVVNSLASYFIYKSKKINRNECLYARRYFLKRIKLYFKSINTRLLRWILIRHICWYHWYFRLALLSCFPYQL